MIAWSGTPMYGFDFLLGCLGVLLLDYMGQ